MNTYFSLDGQAVGMLIIAVGVIASTGILTFKLNNSLSHGKKKKKN